MEWFPNSEAILSHLQNVGDALPKLLEYCSISRFEIFGNPSEQIRQALKGLGGKIFSYYDGFTR